MRSTAGAPLTDPSAAAEPTLAPPGPSLSQERPNVAVLVPCYNEELAVGAVVEGFRRALPEAVVHVCDNGSTDATAARARAAGAVVSTERRKGKGNVIRRMFADIEADVYVMVDGDATYDPTPSAAMVELLWAERLDMVVGARTVGIDERGVAYRRGHTTGNAAFTKALKAVIGGEFTDIFSGYRVMSRRFVKSLPVRSAGFEIETELSAHAVEIDAACAELPVRYTSRIEGSESKLSTYRDGVRIAWTLARLFESFRPLPCFSLLAVALTALAWALAIPVINEFSHSGLVLRFPTIIIATGIQIVALLSLTCGMVLRSVQMARREQRRLAYLRIGPPRGSSGGRDPLT